MDSDPIADSPERADLRSTIGRLVSDVAPPERVRALDEAEEFDEDLFAALAGVGAFAVGAPTAVGGEGDVRDQLGAGPTSMAAFVIAHYAVTQVEQHLGLPRSY